jgi:hypothetical protein
MQRCGSMDAYTFISLHDKVAVTVRVLVMLDIYFVSVKYMFVSIKLMCVYVKFLKI